MRSVFNFKVYAWTSGNAGTANRVLASASRNRAFNRAGDFWGNPLVDSVEVVEVSTGAAVLKLERGGV